MQQKDGSNNNKPITNGTFKNKIVQTINEMAVRIKCIQIEVLNLLNIHVLRAQNNDEGFFELKIKLLKKVV